MRYYFDNEFMEDGQTIDLISIGVACEDGREFYAINEEANWQRIVNDKWLRENVCNHLPLYMDEMRGGEWIANRDDRDPAWRLRSEIATELQTFVTGDNTEFWGYYCDYDWVAVCQLFGRMLDLPRGWPKLSYDLRQWLNENGLRHVRQPDSDPHHALSDARWIAGTHRLYNTRKV